MGMSIQEILAAQQKASKATCKYKTPLVRKPVSKSASNSVQSLLKAQQATANATRKVIIPPSPTAHASTASVSELIERQRITAAAQKAPTSGMNQNLSANQKAVIDSIRARYKMFIAKLDKELADQELVIQPPASSALVEEKPAESFFAPTVPEGADLVVEAVGSIADVNGISVGDEMGGQVAFTLRPKRKRKTKTVKQESETVAEAPVAEA